MSLIQAKRHLTVFKEDGVLERSEAALDTFAKKTVSLNQAKRHLTAFKEDNVFEPSEAALDAFSKKTVSNHAKRHPTLFQI